MPNAFADAMDDYLLSIRSSYVPKTVDGIKEPEKFPDIAENKKTLLGIDLNKNNIRDDAEIYLNSYFKNDFEREIYRQFFRRGQLLIKNHKKMNKPQIEKEINMLQADLECVRYLYDIKVMTERMQTNRLNFDSYKVLYNTKERANLSNDLLTVAGGISSGIRTAEDGYRACPGLVRKKFPLQKK